MFLLLFWLPIPYLKDKWTCHFFKCLQWNCILASQIQINPHKRLWSQPSSIYKINRTFLPCRLVLFHELRLGFTFIVNSCTQTINISSNNVNTLTKLSKHIQMWTKSGPPTMAQKYTCYNRRIWNKTYQVYTSYSE